MSSQRLVELLKQAEACELPLERALTLPPPVFSDPEWFEAERDHVFAGTWIAVARSHELVDANQYITASVAGEPVVVIRGRDGGLRALSNVCRHRGMTIVEGSGSAASLSCPYHLWTYSHTGALLNSPHMESAQGFAKDDHCLPRFAVEEWHGWVLVNLDQQATPVGSRCPSLDSLLAEHRLDEHVHVGSLKYPSPWNWKISVENFAESYHHRGVHPTTLEPAFPGARSFVPDSGNEPWTAVDHVSVVEGEDPFIAITMYPTLLFAILRGVGMVWFKLNPRSPEFTDLVIELHLVPELAEDAQLVEAALAGIAAVNEEDIPVNTRTAEGLRSRHAKQGPISHLEAGTRHFRRWLLSQLRRTETQHA